MTLDRERLFERIADVLGVKTAPEIANKLGLSKQSVYLWRDGNWPSIETLGVIAELSNASLHWLLTGEGEKFVKQAKTSSVHSKPIPPFIQASPATGFEPIPTKIYELTASAVRLEKPIDDGTAMLRLALLRNRTTAEVVSFEIASDDFITDGYRPGRHLVCVPCSLEEAQDGDEVIVEWKGRYYIRLYREHPGAVCLEHLLGLSPPIYAVPKDVKLLYRVVG